jgi:hypothetical protein
MDRRVVSTGTWEGRQIVLAEVGGFAIPLVVDWAIVSSPQDLGPIYVVRQRRV